MERDTGEHLGTASPGVFRMRKTLFVVHCVGTETQFHKPRDAMFGRIGTMTAKRVEP